MYNGQDEDPFEAIRKGFEKFAQRTRAAAGPNGPRPDGRRIARWLLAVAAAALAIWGGLSSFYQVGTEETGVVLRFGRFTTFADPGLHFRLPFGIDRVYQVATGRVLKLEFGFRTVRADVKTEYATKGFEAESLTLTGDLNVSDLEWIVQYQVADPFKYLFRIKDPEEAIRMVAEAAVRMAVGNSNVTEVLTTERAMLATEIQKNLQTILNGYDIGVRIVTVKFQDVNPPEPVKAAFNEVNEAQQEKESLIFQAREQYNREVPKSAGVAKSTILEAEGYAVERLNRAKGETARFLALLAEYSKAPLVTRQRLHLETLEEVLPQIDQIYAMDGKAPSALPLLELRGRTKEVKP
jgi:membrane protease subunit HflK